MGAGEDGVAPQPAGRALDGVGAQRRVQLAVQPAGEHPRLPRVFRMFTYGDHAVRDHVAQLAHELREELLPTLDARGLGRLQGEPLGVASPGPLFVGHASSFFQLA